MSGVLVVPLHRRVERAGRMAQERASLLLLAELELEQQAIRIQQHISGGGAGNGAAATAASGNAAGGKASAAKTKKQKLAEKAREKKEREEQERQVCSVCACVCTYAICADIKQPARGDRPCYSISDKMAATRTRGRASCYRQIVEQDCAQCSAS